jgi:hypothetical protein
MHDNQTVGHMTYPDWVIETGSQEQYDDSIYVLNALKDWGLHLTWLLIKASVMLTCINQLYWSGPIGATQGVEGRNKCIILFFCFMGLVRRCY